MVPTIARITIIVIHFENAGVIALFVIRSYSAIIAAILLLTIFAAIQQRQNIKLEINPSAILQMFYVFIVTRNKRYLFLRLLC